VKNSTGFKALGGDTMEKIIHIAMISIATFLCFLNISFAALVISEGDKIYIEDQRGERWDVTQARTFGFIPQRFQYGIGKNAFSPLQDDDLQDDKIPASSDTRVIGISINDKAHAYTVNRLKYHEIANTTLAGQAIVAGY
jgi:hypothetical protein